MAQRKRKGRLKQALQRAGKAVQKTARKVKKGLGAGAIAATAAIAPLVALFPVMKAIYRKRTGKSLPKNPVQAVKAFYNEVVKKSPGFSYDLDPVTITAIVTAVLSFLRELSKRAKEKKARGEQLTPEEALADQNARSIQDAESAADSPESLVEIAEYIPLMRSIYKQRTGKELPADPFEGARAFYAEVVLPSQRFDFDATLAFDAGEEAYDYEEEAYDADRVDIKTVIAGIVAFFRAVRDRVREKEAAGESVSQAEKTIADKVDKTESEIRGEVKGQIVQDVKSGIGDAVFRFAPLVLAGGLLLYLARKQQ